jgi:hypothetical protein
MMQAVFNRLRTLRAQCTTQLMALLAVAVFPASGSFAGDCSDPPVQAGLDAFCGIEAPEDLVLFEDRFLLISSMAPGTTLYSFDLARDQLAPLETVLQPISPGENWANPDCALPRQLLTHGLDLSRRASGEWQLLAVNHEARESIEYFEVQDDDAAVPRLRWRGCVMAAENAQFNDVAGLPDGGFLATDPITASMQLPRMLFGALGGHTGQVYRWRPASGYSPVPHTEGAYPNGVLLSADGQSFYLNLYLSGEVREHDLASGEILNRVAVAKPDNSSLASDGSLLVASHDASIFTLLSAITSAAAERNGIPFEIIRVDPADFSANVLFRSEGDTLGGGTVAQQVGSDLYIGAFRGDRILRVTQNPRGN